MTLPLHGISCCTERDAADLAALHRAPTRGVPVPGICRSHQLLDVALGGTRHQHLPDARVAAARRARTSGFRPVRVAGRAHRPATRTAAVLDRP
ncbi:gamma-glutamyl-gamma-aminobutyrate hydrolase family protein [Pseudonocardia tropica]|uniref:Gamma-glutamyl-gamma-aminobutyrate hydrolase family protein n=1 Tax=Pseudonocardia tropica TaxID=681289 RepID=A0ABV1JRP4_9PSEU